MGREKGRGLASVLMKEEEKGTEKLEDFRKKEGGTPDE